MTFNDMLQSDLDAIYTANEFDQEITINGIPVRAMVSAPSPTTEQYPAIANVALFATVRVSEVAAVEHGDTAVANGVTYVVVGEPINNGLEWVFELDRHMVSV